MENKSMRQYEVWRSLRDGDFQEDDMWNVLDGYNQSSFMISNHATKTTLSTQSLLPSEPRMIPERQNRGGMSLVRQNLAPINVPDWSMVNIRKTTKGVVDDEDDDDERISPEEYFMKRGRSSSSSVMEGVGRKLKGRDLRNVRNGVLKKTGFLE